MLVNTYKLKIIFTTLAVVITGYSAKAQIMTLQQCIDTALVYNKNLKIQRNQVEISNQKKEEIKGNLLPKVNLNTDYKYYTNLPYQYMSMSLFGGPVGQYKEVQFGVPHNVNGSLQLSLPLYNPQIKGGMKSAEIGIELNNLQLKKTEEQVYFEVSNLYYNAQILAHQIRYIDSNLANTQKLLNIMQLLKEQLMATGTDVNKVALQADQLRLQKATIESKEEQLTEALKFLMGVSSTKEIQIDPEISYDAVNNYQISPTVEMQITTTQNRLLNNELNNLKKSALPTIALFGTYGINGFGYDKSPDYFLKFHPVVFAGIQLTYSLFDGYMLRSKKNQKEIEIRNNELLQALITDENAMQIRNARSRKSIAAMSIDATNRQIAQAQAIYEQTLLQQKEGLAKLNNVLIADNTLREAQQSNIAAIVDYLKADLELKKLTGNLSIKN